MAHAEWELVSFAPIEHGFAALGLADKFNSTGAVVARSWEDGACRVALRDGGAFLGWSARPPRAVRCDGEVVRFTYDGDSGRLGVDIAPGGRRTLCVYL